MSRRAMVGNEREFTCLLLRPGPSAILALELHTGGGGGVSETK